MKKISILMGTALTLSILLTTVVPVLAHSDGTTHKEEDGTTTEAKTVSPEEAAKKAAELKKRLEDNKAKLKTKLDEATKKRIATKCKSAQTVVKGAETSANAITTNRAKAYAKIGESIQKLVDRLKASNIDTTNLEAAQKVAATKAAALSTAMKTYEATLADLREMDCVADPAAFQATLESARTQRELVKIAATDLRAYISPTLKTEINKVKALLQATKTESDTTQDEAEGTR